MVDRQTIEIPTFRSEAKGVNDFLSP